MALTKKNFIDLISVYDPKEINDLIKSKGKKPKIFNPIVIVGEEPTSWQASPVKLNAI